MSRSSAARRRPSVLRWRASSARWRRSCRSRSGRSRPRPPSDSTPGRRRVREVTDAEVRAAVDDRALVDACTAALAALGRGEASQAAKQMLPAAGGGFFLSISAVVPALGWAISKWASYVPAEGGAGRSTSTILAGPADGSAPTAVLRGMLPTRLRTAAAAVAAIEALGRADAASPVALVGFGPTNRAVADMLSSLHGVRSWRVLVRSDAAGDRARAALPGEVVVGGRDAL
ncbi:MAG TPA: hypothetical protein DCP95_09720, partial [Microbacterium ginsengisoli]|nr:hypothetical protein [Microbacterium ginsengisoli]